MRLWEQINNALVYILIVAAVVSGILQEWKEVALIIGVIAINITIGMVQEGRAEKAAEAIKAMLSSRATVVRNGERLTVEADQIVPGDIVFVSSGDGMPADVRFIQVTKLQVQEAMLTGESLPVAKNLLAVSEEGALGDRKCMGYSTTLVMSGQALGVVTATGDRAEIGKINAMVGGVESTRTNLVVQLEIFGRWISIIVIIIAVSAFLIAMFVGKEEWGDAFNSAVAIAVAIIPEGLPAVVTITLAMGISHMASNNAIIRQLPAVETLGSLTVICSDKTGTLTKNEMTVVVVQTVQSQFKVSGVGYEPVGAFSTASGAPVTDGNLASLQRLLEVGMLCNDSAVTQSRNEQTGVTKWATTGDPTELALLTAGMKAGMEAKVLQKTKPRVGGIPFESDHKFMATVHRAPDAPVYTMMVKGATDRLLKCCAYQVINDDVAQREPIDPELWLKAAADLSCQGLRVLALCQAELPLEEDVSDLGPKYLTEGPPLLTIVCLAAILDPPRDECIPAIREAHQAGIVVKMITGDHAQTALAIGRMLGIVDGKEDISYTGPELDAMSDEQLQGIVRQCNVFARSSPENKIRIVRALQAVGEVVSMTGDGVNDAPALKAANVGVAMGITGTDVSKEAAKMVLADDNFATIVKAIKEGRRVWNNIRKVLIFNTPVNFAQGLCVFFAYALQFEDCQPTGEGGEMVCRVDVPLSAIQVLYVNLITSVTMGLMLAAEPPEDDIMMKPPRNPNKRLLGKVILWRCFFVASLLIVLVLGIFAWGKAEGYSKAERQTEAFNVLVFSEIAYSMNCRYIKASSFHVRAFTGNRLVYISVFIAASLQIFLTYTPAVQDVFNCVPISPLQWARILVCMVVVFIIVEIEKLLVDPLLMPLVRPLLRALGWLAPQALHVPTNPSNIRFIATSASSFGMPSGHPVAPTSHAPPPHNPLPALHSVSQGHGPSAPAPPTQSSHGDIKLEVI